MVSCLHRGFVHGSVGTGSFLSAAVVMERVPVEEVSEIVVYSCTLCRDSDRNM